MYSLLWLSILLNWRAHPDHWKRSYGMRQGASRSRNIFGTKYRCSLLQLRRNWVHSAWLQRLGRQGSVFMAQVFLILFSRIDYYCINLRVASKWPHACFAILQMHFFSQVEGRRWRGLQRALERPPAGQQFTDLNSLGLVCFSLFQLSEIWCCE